MCNNRGLEFTDISGLHSYSGQICRCPARLVQLKQLLPGVHDVPDRLDGKFTLMPLYLR